MLSRLASLTVRRHRRVLIAALVLFAVAGAVGGGVAKHLSSGGFDNPSSPSSRVKSALAGRFNQGDPNLLLLVTAKAGTVDSPAVRAEGTALTQELGRQPGVALSVSYWTLGSPGPLRSKDAHQALVLARLSGTDDQVRNTVKALSPRFTRADPVMTVRAGGYAEIFRQVSAQIEKDLKLAEGIAIPVTILLLIVVFGSAAAASLPLAIGALSVVGTFLVLRILASLTQVSIFSLNLTTAMGLGLAIDYSLFVVSRYREELATGRPVAAAVVRAVETAGRTVIFSAFTVAASLAALLVFPLAFLRSFAYAGIAVVAVAATGAVVVLPALLAALGTRVEWGHLPFLRRRTTPPPVGEGFWHRLATSVMRRPILTGGSVVALLLLLGVPFLSIRFGLPDDRVLPAAASSRMVSDQIRHNFPDNEAGAVSIVTSAPATPAEIAAYAERLSTIPGTARVDALTGSYLSGHQVVGATPLAAARFTPVHGPGTWFSLIPSVEPLSPAGEHLVKGVRATPAPFKVEVGGQSAQLVDAKASIFARLPLAAALIGLVTFTVLFLFTGSLLVPAKAVVLNLLSLSATFGAMVWIFQDGHLASTLHFTPTGFIDTTTPILMFCIAFGLSMDYEVFLLSRIKEEHDRTGDNVASVAVGLERTGRIVGAAAALLALVFLAFATSQVTFIKLFGIGLAMAVLVDATLVRAVLVPAFMRLAGDANWWAPAPLRRIYNRIGIHEAADEADQADKAGEVDVPVLGDRPQGSRTVLTGIVADRDLGRVAAESRSIQYRRDVLRSYDRAASLDDALAVLRREGVQPSDLDEWRRELPEGARP
jgi:RND superfamily putative drug exporter